jgi:hypothetical protein
MKKAKKSTSQSTTMATDQFPRAQFPVKISRVSLWMIWTWVALVVLDMSGMIVNIMAYTGAQSSDDRKVIKETFVTFPKRGDHVQRAMIALVSSSSSCAFYFCPLSLDAGEGR